MEVTQEIPDSPKLNPLTVMRREAALMIEIYDMLKFGYRSDLDRPTSSRFGIHAEDPQLVNYSQVHRPGDGSQFCASPTF